MNLLPFSRIYQDLRPPHASAEPCLHLELSPLQSWAQGQCPGTQRTSFWTLGQLFLEDSSVGHITLFPSFFLSYSCLLLQKVVIFILNVEFSKYFLQLAHLISLSSVWKVIQELLYPFPRWENRGINVCINPL